MHICPSKSYRELCIIVMLFIIAACSGGEDLSKPDDEPSPLDKANIAITLDIDSHGSGLPILTTTEHDELANWSATDCAVKTYTAWVFNYDSSVGQYIYSYCVRNDQTIENQKAISLKAIEGKPNKWTLWVLLRESDVATKVVITSNLRNQLSSTPNEGEMYNQVMHNQLVYDIRTNDNMMTSVPLIGETSFTNGIHNNLNTSTLTLEKMISKIVIEHRQTTDITIEAIKIGGTNQIARGDGMPDSSASASQQVSNHWISASHGRFTAYIAPTNELSKSYMLVKALYQGVRCYYKLHFVNPYQQTELLETIERNRIYSLFIGELIKIGYKSEEDAIASSSSLDQSDTLVRQFASYQEDTMDVTTDDRFFLGTTSGPLTMQDDDKCYYAHFTVIANTAWTILQNDIAALPGVSVSISEALSSKCINQDGSYNMLSIWVYLDKKTYEQNKSRYPRNNFSLNVYTGQIQKKISFLFGL